MDRWLYQGLAEPVDFSVIDLTLGDGGWFQSINQPVWPRDASQTYLLFGCAFVLDESLYTILSIPNVDTWSPILAERKWSSFASLPVYLQSPIEGTSPFSQAPPDPVTRKPLTLNAGAIEQLPDGQGLDVGGWTLPASGGNETYVIIADSSGNGIWANPPWPTIPAANTTIFVRKTGNDNAGNGSLDTPYLTVERALVHVNLLSAGPYTISVSIGEGNFAESALTFDYSFGSKVTFRGEYEDHAGLTATNFTGATGAASNLDYYDFDITLPADKTATVGDFCIIRTATGAAADNPHLARGCHEIITWDSGNPGTITVRAYVRADNGGKLAGDDGGDVTCDISIMKTVLTFVSTGLVVSGPNHGGTWDRLVFSGGGGGNGFLIRYGATITLGSRFGSSGFASNIACTDNASVFGNYSHHSRAATQNVYAINSSVVVLQYACLTAANTYGISITKTSLVDAYFIDMYSPGIVAILIDKASFVEGAGGDLRDPKAAGSVGVLAQTGSGCRMTAGNITNFATEKSPAANPGNTEAYILGP